MNQAGVHDPVNLGNPDEFTILELANKVRSMAHSSSAFSHRPLPPDDPGRRRPDISRARELLGWVPTISLEQGLKQTIPYFAEKLKQEGCRVRGQVKA
jgi:nucleoside-diphosphate-sugar epimerase